MSSLKTIINKTAWAVGFAGALLVETTALTITAESTGNVVIPDNDLNGVVRTINVNNQISEISSVVLSMTIVGWYNGDYYAYLKHDTGFSVLLNRIGATSMNPDGSDVSGMNISLSDSATTDIHLAIGVDPLSGVYKPDARAISPFAVSDLSPRSADLSVFNGLSSSGAWSLFIADVSPGGVGILTRWSLEITGTPSGLPLNVPDLPGTGLILVFASSALLLLRKRNA
jgi:subtilisin-like proprotein convertase family protein